MEDEDERIADRAEPELRQPPLDSGTDPGERVQLPLQPLWSRRGARRRPALRLIESSEFGRFDGGQRASSIGPVGDGASGVGEPEEADRPRPSMGADDGAERRHQLELRLRTGAADELLQRLGPLGRPRAGPHRRLTWTR